MSDNQKYIEIDLVLNSKISDLEKLDALISSLENTSFKNEEVLNLINKVIGIKSIDESKLLKLFKWKCLALHNLGRSKEGILCCKEFEQVLESFPESIKYWIINERFKLIFLFDNGKQNEAVSIGESILQKFAKSEDVEILKELTEVYWRMGWLGINFYPYRQCLEYLNQAIVLGEKFKQYEELLSAYVSIGIIYKNNKDFDNGLSYLKLALKISAQENNELIPTIMSHIAKVLMELKSYEEAKYFFDKALELNSKKYSTRSELLTLMGLAEFYIITKDKIGFEVIESKISRIPYFQNDIYIKADFYRLMSEASFNAQDYKQALNFCDEYEEMQKIEKGFVETKNCYELKIKILKELKEFEEVVKYYDKLILIREEILNVSNQKALSEFEAKFQNEKKAKEIQTLKLESISFQLQSLRSQMNPHFIFNTIGSISTDLKIDNIDKSKTLLNNFSSLMRSTLDFADTERITLEEEIEFLENYLNLEKYRLEDNLQYEIIYSNGMSNDFIEIPSMIIQPYIENAIKHGIKPLEVTGEIKIEFLENEDFLICTITDNGIGREKALKNSKKFQKHIGKSTTINAKRLSLIKSKDQDSVNVKYSDLFDENQNPLGTKVELSIKL